METIRYLDGDDFCLKVQSNLKPASKLAYGSWAMYQDQGILDLPILEMALAERNLGIAKALSIQSPKRGYISSQTTRDIEEYLHGYDELAFELNQDYLNLTNPSQIESICIPSGNDILQNIHQIRSKLSQLIEQGHAIIPDRNSSLLQQLIRPNSLEATYNLNDKAYFTNLLHKNGLEVPNSQIITISKEELEDILKSPDSSIQDTLQRYVNYNIYPEGYFFLKISAQSGGEGVLKLPNQHTEEIRKFFQEYKQCIASNQDIQLLACQAITPSNAIPETEVLSDQINYVTSPCLIFAITNDNFQYGQVAAQVLKDGTTYIGSMWDENVDRNFYLQQSTNIDLLAKTIQSTGYEGLFGTDYIYNNDGIYKLIADGNARANGSHLSLSYRQSLTQNGHIVTRTFQSRFQIDSANLNELREFTLSQNSQGEISGAILIPSYSLEFAQQESPTLSLHSIYINPQNNPANFEAFQRINS